MRKPWTDDRAERVLGAVACLVLATILGMVVFVFAKAWPSFSHNGLGWFGSFGWALRLANKKVQKSRK